MKKYVSILLALVLVLALAACGSSSNKKDEASLTLTAGKLAVSAEIGYPPMEYFDEDGSTPIGFDVEMMTEIAKRMGLELELIDTAWDGIFAGLDSDKYDMVMSSCSITPQRQENYLMSKPYPQQDWEAHLFKEKKCQFVRDIIMRLTALLEESPLAVWNHREYLFFKEHWQDVLNGKQLNLTDNEFLGSGLQMYYQHLVFEHRNRIAHNTASYLKDVPTLDTLADKEYVYKNYFFRFAILLVIDELFVRLFKMYRELGKSVM